MDITCPPHVSVNDAQPLAPPLAEDQGYSPVCARGRRHRDSPDRPPRSSGGPHATSRSADPRQGGLWAGAGTRQRALGGGAGGGEGEGGRRAGGEDPGSSRVFDRTEGGRKGRGGPLGACRGAAPAGPPGAVGRASRSRPSTRLPGRDRPRGSPGSSARAQSSADLPPPPPPPLCCSPSSAGCCCWRCCSVRCPQQKFSALTFLRVDQDKDKDCSLDCAGSPQKPLCASDGRTFLSRCEFQRAKCKDPQLEIAYRGNCKDVSRCVAERKYTQEQARKEFQQVFIPECNDDGTYSQVQCHSYTGYCWCVTPNGRPISGTAVAHKTPRCPGSINEKLPQREGTGKTDDAAAPALETQPQGDEEDIASRYPTLWTEQVKSRQNKTNKNSVSSCDQEHQSALEEAKQPKNDNVVIPECAHGGLYKPVQCHPSTGYCWCVLVDTGRPIPGTSTRYEQPKCDNTARAHPAKARDLYKGRQLQGCPGAKKHEFLTSILDALSTDMVHAVSDPSSSSGRLSEPDPSHTLEERVVHWYFRLLDKNSSGDIGKKEIKPFKRFLRKKSKPKKCVKKFVEYCDVNNDKSISVQELMGCLGVAKEDGKADTKKRHTPRGNTESTSNRQPRKQG
ncbi:SPARC-related modular calcium-binding protein 2 [Rhinopithecus roxellana]|uniref:SPARC-related modular calcium-binding protein 2 n=1 Tax=Rhinopithecus roxellana TaxID=61622 RepID=UPI0012377019|nr:SPARC-related modular calcium-binding protein 2 [Rhinopithecus roxellana]